jgi:hypothetical protein
MQAVSFPLSAVSPVSGFPFRKDFVCPYYSLSGFFDNKQNRPGDGFFTTGTALPEI